MPAPSRKKTSKKSEANRWSGSIDHLRSVDPKWGEIIDRVGPCKLEGRPDRFGTLVRAIIGQQISSKAAASIDKKLRDLAGDPHEPRALLAQGEEKLRSVGLSRTKAQYVTNLAEAVLSGSVKLHEFDDKSDEEITAALTSVKGIGDWTAEMFLIFCMLRPDVLSSGDLGIRVALKNFHGLDDLPTPKTCRALTEPLRPHRTVAMWYLWETIDNP